MDHGEDSKTWLTAREIACARLPGLPHTARGVRRLARREGWHRQRDGQKDGQKEGQKDRLRAGQKDGQTGGDGRVLIKHRRGRGGGFLYHVTLLPPSARAAWRAHMAKQDADLSGKTRDEWLRPREAPTSAREDREIREAREKEGSGRKQAATPAATLMASAGRDRPEMPKRPHGDGETLAAYALLWQRYGRLPARQKQIAHKRLEAIMLVEALLYEGPEGPCEAGCDSCCEGPSARQAESQGDNGQRKDRHGRVTKDGAVRHVALMTGLPRSSFYVWFKRIAAVPREHWLPVLVDRRASKYSDQYSGNRGSGRQLNTGPCPQKQNDQNHRDPNHRGDHAGDRETPEPSPANHVTAGQSVRYAGTGSPRRRACPEAAFEALKADWLRYEKPSFMSCYRRLEAVAKDKGWVLPCSRSLYRQMMEDVPVATRVLLREGPAALKRLWPAQERDRSCFQALEAVNADGHVWDVFVMWPDSRTGVKKPVRPVMVAIQDLYSGKILAWRLGRRETTQLVLLTFMDLFQDYGIPAHAWFDNGKAFRGKRLVGGLLQQQTSNNQVTEQAGGERSGGHADDQPLTGEQLNHPFRGCCAQEGARAGSSKSRIGRDQTDIKKPGNSRHQDPARQKIHPWDADSCQEDTEEDTEGCKPPLYERHGSGSDMPTSEGSPSGQSGPGQQAQQQAGILTMLGVQVHRTLPYSGQSKPIERAFRDFCDAIAKHPLLAGAYTGSSPSDKPANYGSRAVELELFRSVVDEGIKEHNARPGRRTGVCGGRLSFNEAFDASYGVVATQTVSTRKATAEQLAPCLPSASMRSDSTDGSLRLAGKHLDHYGGYGSRRYWSEILLEHRGSSVTVRFDPDHPESVRVYSMDGSFLCTAGRLRPAGFDDTAAAGEHARARKTFMQAFMEGAKAQSGDVTPLR